MPHHLREIKNSTQDPVHQRALTGGPRDFMLIPDGGQGVVAWPVEVSASLRASSDHH